MINSMVKFDGNMLAVAHIVTAMSARIPGLETKDTSHCTGADLVNAVRKLEPRQREALVTMMVADLQESQTIVSNGNETVVE